MGPLGLRQDLVIEVSGEFYTVRGDLDLRAWLSALHEPLPLLAVLPFREAQALNRRSYDNDDDVDVQDFADGWHEALKAATGMDWWVAERLMLALVGDWSELAGMLLLKGIDALTAPPDMVLSALLAMALEGRDDKERRKFLTQLTTPPVPPRGAPRGARPGFSPEEQGAAFLAAQNARTAGMRT